MRSTNPTDGADVQAVENRAMADAINGLSRAAARICVAGGSDRPVVQDMIALAVALERRYPGAHEIVRAEQEMSLARLLDGARRHGERRRADA